jgi:hypothetical protein
MARKLITTYAGLLKSVRAQEIAKNRKGGAFLLDADPGLVPCFVYIDEVTNVISIEYLDSHVEFICIELIAASRIGKAMLDNKLSGP